MKTLKLVLCAIAFTLLRSSAYAYTLTFDDLPDGSYVYGSAVENGAYFGGTFAVADHSNSTWGRPHSGNNVLVSTGVLSSGMLKFRMPTNRDVPYSVYSLSAYFSTEYGKRITITGYRGDKGHPVVSAQIGAVGESWDNVLVTLSSNAGDMNFFLFEGDGTPAGLLGFCADDMTIVPVPEPSSLLVFGAGLVPLMLRRRKR